MSAAKIAAKGYRERNQIQGTKKVEGLTLGHNYNIFDNDDLYGMKPSEQENNKSGPGVANRRA